MVVEGTEGGGGVLGEVLVAGVGVGPDDECLHL
jgi:hypothetical protein